MTAIEKYKINQKKLEELELFYKIKGRLPSHSAKTRKEDVKPEELEYEALLGSWLNRKRFDNSDLDNKQLERLSVFLPKEKKRTPEEVCLELIEFINRENKLPIKRKITDKIADVEKQEAENRLSRWLTTNKKKQFINVDAEERQLLQKVLQSFKAKNLSNKKT